MCSSDLGTTESAFSLKGYGVLFNDPGDVTESGLKFNHALFETTSMMITLDRYNDFIFDKATVSELVPYFSDITSGRFLDITLTFKGTHSEKQFISTIYIDGYTNSSTISNIGLDNSGLVF